MRDNRNGGTRWAAKKQTLTLIPRSFGEAMWRTLFYVLLIASLPATAYAKVQLAAIFGDKMMLQRNSKAAIWGFAEPGEHLTLTLTDGAATADTLAGPDGWWIATFNGLKPGGPFVLTVSGKTETIVISDVLVGDVWICSGQSNMEYQLKDADEIAAPEDPDLRYLLFPKNVSLDPVTEITGTPHWVSASPATRPQFTAVGYYFGKKLRRETGVPIGLIHTSWGGTAAELWIPKEALDAIPAFKDQENSLINSVRSLDADAARFADAFPAWEKRYGPIDPGNKGFEAGWANPDFDAADWKTINYPGDWTDFGIPNGGVVWVRRTIPVSAELTGKDLRINLDAISDFDTTYFNGQEVGKGGMVSPYFWGNGRLYVIMSPWVAKVETAFQPMPSAVAESEPKPPTARRDGTPTVLFNAMILPLIPYGMKGVIWYQGEANVLRGYNYRTIFPTLIESWRTRWGIGDFPFYFVQLANLGSPPKDPNEASGWAELRESQLMTWKITPNTGMAVAVDIGEARNIHPLNKKDVGDRLALIALAKDYGQKIEYSGPVYEAMKIAGDKIHLTFSHTGAGLVTKGGGPLKQFAIAGADHKFSWAEAVIEGNEVVVSSKDVPSPVAVRYAWFSDPEGLNLYNRDGLPASPFRTDTWDTPTVGIWWNIPH